MARITVDVNESWLADAKEVLGTDTKVATINEALRSFAVRKQATEIMDALDRAVMIFEGSGDSFGHGGGRDLSRLAEDAKSDPVA